MKRLLTLIASLAFASIAYFGDALAQERTITVASTTSTEQSGLFGHLLPRFTESSISVGASMPTWYSCTTRSPKTNSSPRALA